MWIIKDNRIYTEHGRYYITREEARNLKAMMADGFGHWAYERAKYLINNGYAVRGV